VARRHPQLRQLVHPGKAGHDRVPDERAVVLADQEAAALLRGHELHQGPLVAPILEELLTAAHLVDQAARAARLVPRGLAELVHGLEVARATFAKRELAH